MAYVDTHTAVVSVPPDVAWDAVRSLGGDERFYAPQELWRLRGLADRLIGGPGHRIGGPGRPLEEGDAMDFWEVVEVHPPTRLRARALSRLPGTAYLDLEVHARVGDQSNEQDPGSLLTVRTTFEPAGLAGHAYWWSTVVAHRVTFELMTRRLAAMVRGT